MKKTFRVIIACFMALIMFLSNPLCTLAAQNQYISDVKIGYGDSGKKALLAAGYSVWDNLDANKGGIYEESDEWGKKTSYGSAVYIGYKTTADKDDAITDIGLMNMAGNYSYTDWADEVDAMWEEAERMVDRFQFAIETFRENYKEAHTEGASDTNTDFASLAYRMLNFYYEDDTKETLGNLFINENTSDETLETVFMQGNSECVQGIEYYLTLGSAEEDGNTFLKRIAEADIYAMTADEEEDIDEEKSEDESAGQALDESLVPLNQAVTIIIDSISYTKETVNDYKNRLENLESFTTEEEYLNSLDDENKASYQYGKQVYTVLSETPYGNIEGTTLLDIVELSETEKNEQGLMLNKDTIAPLAKCMTAAQIGLMEFVGLDVLLIMADNMKDEETREAYREEVVSKIEETEKEYSGQTVSVYNGVDRDLFTDTENIALTGEAVKNRAIAEGTEFGKKTETESKVLTWVMGSIGMALIVAGAGIFAFTAYTMFDGLIAVSRLVKLFGSAFVCMVAGCILFGIASEIQTEVKYENVNYTKIPRILVDIKTQTNALNNREEKEYVPYYAAENIEAKAGETDTTKLYGDLNGLSGKAQWLVLYYSKHELAGNPLKAGNLLIKEGSGFTSSELSGYQAFHLLGNTSAANLNQYHVNGAQSLYVAVPEYASAAGSVFADGSLWNVCAGVGLFASGAVISFFLTKSLNRKKKKLAGA